MTTCHTTFMSEQQVLEQASFGEFVGAKVEAKINAVNEWLAVPDNAENALFLATLGSAAVTTGIEVAAQIVGKKDPASEKVKSVGLHVLAIAAGAETLLSSMIFGSVSGENKVLKKMGKPRKGI